MLKFLEDKRFFYVSAVLSMPSKLKLALILNGMPTIIYTLTVVSMESFINKEREEKDIK